jgi:uncharacterized protein
VIWFPEIPFPFARFFSKPEPMKLLAPPAEPQALEIILPQKTSLEIGPDFTLPAGEWAHDVILAASGFGKSYLAGVLAEEILETGGLMVIIDPEGENWTLADRYPLLIVGGDHATVGLNLEDASREQIDEVMETVLTQGVSVVFDLSERTPKAQRELFTLISGSLFTMQDRPELRRPVKFIVEEARVFAPQKASDLPKNQDGETCLSVFENIATRGRKRGINMLVATQRPASISKDILSQCNRWWFGGMQSEQDCKALKPHLEEAGVTADDIKRLPKGSGEFYYYANGDTQKIQVRTRKCKHGGTTPTVEPEKLKIANKADVAAATKRLNQLGAADQI